MSKSAKSESGRKAAGPGQLWLRLPGLVGAALYETVIGVGLACVDEALEAERAVAVWRALRASGRAAGAARGTRGQFAGAGRAAGCGEPPAGAQC
jgi:hypothetical protein